MFAYAPAGATSADDRIQPHPGNPFYWQYEGPLILLLGVLHYKIHFNNPGRYYVWVRTYSTGTEDNGIHVGLNGEWPASGQRMQWCEGKDSCRWESKQRTTEVHCGVPHGIYLDIPTAGEHEIQFSMREDGFEFDKFLLTTDRDFSRPDDAGPEPRIRHGVLPPPFPSLHL